MFDWDTVQRSENKLFIRDEVHFKRKLGNIPPRLKLKPAQQIIVYSAPPPHTHTHTAHTHTHTFTQGQPALLPLLPQPFGFCEASCGSNGAECVSRVLPIKAACCAVRLWASICARAFLRRRKYVDLDRRLPPSPLQRVGHADDAEGEALHEVPGV